MSDFTDLDQVTLAVYRAVLLHREADPAVLAERLGIPVDQADAAVKQLIDMTLLAPSWEQPDRLRAVSPALGIEVLVQREQQELAMRQQRIEQNRAALASLAAEFAAQGQAGAAGDTEYLCGIDAIRTRLASLCASCTRESLAFHPEGALPAQAIAAGQPLNEPMLRRGVHFRSIYLDSMRKDRPTRENVEWHIARGGEARTVPTLPMRILVIDGATAMIPAPSIAGQQRALMLHSPPVVQAIQALFEAYWQHATPFGEPVKAPDGGLTPQEREVLHLLASGITDEAAARALGIGVRTERRIVAELMDRLQATSRFEAGVKAAKLGLL
ncbi:LuxR C-terminal-related transcriptional regulator [Streptacidiphilus sp. EB129]|uniref:helix-turn-helix transcriptional regulator n=1 Tax=Streptacidiphilus sp. EB129 TaxID=3156262 RepID=UPI003511CEE8